MAEKLHRVDEEQVAFFCPGCQCWHGVRIAGEGQPRWLWNGNMEFPTFTPGIHIGGACHSFVINGTIQFLRSSTHSRSGQTVEIPDCHDPIQNKGMRPAAASVVMSARLCKPVCLPAKL